MKTETPTSIGGGRFIYVNSFQSPLYGEGKLYELKIKRIFIGSRYEISAIEKRGSSYVYTTGSNKGGVISQEDIQEKSIIDFSKEKGEIEILLNEQWEEESIAKHLRDEHNWYSILKSK
ncbi:hypothetical protein SMD22_01665 (plasmid) [Brevibacillus halotolerans]|nr:hypothetical protein SMD22_01665 [Brevibacillus halotolerans]